MKKPPYLFQRGGIWYHRVTVPPDIVELYAKLYKKKNRIVSLGTKDKREAEKLGRIKGVEADREFESCRAQLRGEAPSTPDRVPDIPIKQECDARYREIIEADFIWRAETRAKAEADPNAFYRGDLIDLYDTQRYYDLTQDGADLDRMLRYVFKADLRHRLRRAQDDLASGRYDVDGNPKLALGLLQAKIRAFEALSSRDFPDIEDDDSKAPVVEHDAPLFTEAAEKYMDEKRRSGLPLQTEEAKEAIHRDFVAVAGNKALSAYTKSDGVAFKEALIKVPSGFTKHKEFKGLNIVNACIRAEGRTDVKRLSITTINDKLIHVSAFFTWAQNNHDADIANPVKGLKLANPVSRRDRRDPFTIDELVKLFNAPLYAGCESATNWSTQGMKILRDNSKFWVPLVGLFSGLRLGEIIQLDCADIREADGIAYFDVNKDEHGKSLKTAGSERRVPIHPELLALGFLDFVKTRKGRIFSDYKQNKKGSWSDAFSKHFARFRKIVGVGKTFHSLRHSFEDVCLSCEVRADVIDSIQGHTQQGMRAVYGSGHDLKTLNKAMKKIMYDGLDLSHLRP